MTDIPYHLIAFPPHNPKLVSFLCHVIFNNDLILFIVSPKKERETSKGNIFKSS